MSTKLKKKLIEGMAPITLAECVMIGDGTSDTLKDRLEKTQNNNTPTGSTNRSASVEGGNVFFEKTDARTITYSAGQLVIQGKVYNITSGVASAKDYTEWNPGNPNYTTYFVFNVETEQFAFRGAFKSTPTLLSGDYIIFVSYSDNNNTYIKTLNYDNRYIKQKVSPYEKVINRLTVIGDSLTAVGKWYEVVDDYNTKLKVLNKNISAVAGATLYDNGLNLASSVQKGDTVVLFMGTNDCLREVTIGSIEDDSSTDSFCGRAKKIIESIYNKDMSIRILVVGGSPLNGYSSGLGHGAKYYKDVLPFDEALRGICKQYAIPYLSLIENIGINSYNHASTQIDGCHYTGDMYKMLGHMIYEKLYQII